MAQHRRISLREVEDTLDILDMRGHFEEEERIQDLLRVLVVVDQTLVKHDKTPVARRLRQAFFRYSEDI